MPHKKTPTPDHLDAYRAKRSLERTPEPAGSVSPDGAGGLFVVHQHAARRLHFDLRLEMEGVLRSWAVPKGPSYDTAEKRLAVHVEDHPLEYGDFEGLIPAGNYGAGAVIVWDRGEWAPVGDPLEGLAKGKLLFELRGYKLHGMWTLVKLKKSEKDWLLIQERDGWASKDGEELPAESVLSGLTVEELGEGADRGEAIRRELTRLGAARRPVDVKSVGLMLAETADAAFTRKDWLFEPKLDGYRVLASRGGSEPRPYGFSGTDPVPARKAGVAPSPMWPTNLSYLQASFGRMMLIMLLRTNWATPATFLSATFATALEFGGLGPFPVYLDLDRTTRLPVCLRYRLEMRTADGPTGEVLEEFLRVDEWQDISGIKIPRHVTRSREGKIYTDYRFTTIQVNPPLTAADFK